MSYKLLNEVRSRNNGIKLKMITDVKSENDDIDLSALLATLWTGKWTIVTIAIVVTLLSLIYALNLPNTYKSEVLLAPTEEKSASGLSGQLGGLATLAGVDIGKGSGVDNVTLALEILKSRHFISKFIEKHELLVPVMAAEAWDYKTNSLIIDKSIYDVEKREWRREVNPPRQAKPSLQEASKEFSTLFDVSVDSESKMVTLSFAYYSPVLSKQWLDLIVIDINEEIRGREIQEAERSISYLTAQIQQTNISEVKGALFSLVEEQTKKLMLANARDEYILKVVDPAVIPEEKFKPKRAIIVAIALLIGGTIGTFVVLISAGFRNRKSQSENLNKVGH